MSDAGSHLNSDAGDDVSDADAGADEQQTADPTVSGAETVDAAVAQLEESDAHGKKVTAWLTKLAHPRRGPAAWHAVD